MNSIITASVATLERVLTTHNQGYKQVFLRDNDNSTKLTQFAYGEFSSSDHCELHLHTTMEEYFFFIKGEGTYIVGDQEISLYPGVFVRVPSGISHRLVAAGAEPLAYVYFGIATN